MIKLNKEENSESQLYDDVWYESQKKSANTSAKVIADVVMDLVHPHSIVDIGCASGVFLKEFQLHGCDILGVDSPWINNKTLVIPLDKFIHADLEKKLPKINRKFDLAICVETGEHIGKEHANPLVKYLTSLSDIILFSAAIPLQGAGPYHVNEQWQSYWAKKFIRLGYIPIDCIRPILWDKKGVDVHYRQNTFLYVKTALAHKYLELQRPILNIVHPEYWIRDADPRLSSAHYILKGILYMPRRAFGRYLKGKIYKIEKGKVVWKEKRT